MIDITPELIRNYVNESLGLDIRIKKRTRDYIYARAIYNKLCRVFTGCNLSEISKEGSHKVDHAKVLHSINYTFENMITYEPFFYNFYLQAFDYFDWNKIIVTDVNLLDGGISFKW